VDVVGAAVVDDPDGSVVEGAAVVGTEAVEGPAAVVVVVAESLAHAAPTIARTTTTTRRVLSRSSSIVASIRMDCENGSVV
jgi:hypothetical protein